MDEVDFVMAWVTEGIPPLPDLSGTEKWLMVEHKERGWELPGGKLNPNEGRDDAILREICEETGILGYIRNKPKRYQRGLVYWIGVIDDKEFNKIKDLKINSAKWFSSPPTNLAWGEAELKEISQIFYTDYYNSDCSKI